MVEVTLDILVRCTEIDVNGHVNNGKFVEYLEWGREEWYDRQGLDYDRLQEMGAATVVVNMNINLRQACHQGDALRVVTWPVKRGRTSFVLGQRIERGGAVVADAAITLVTVDPATGKSRPLPDELARLLPEGGDAS